MTTFANWCLLRGVPDMPAAPADVAQFVTDCAPLGIDKVWDLVQEISRLHYARNLADPTAGGPVASAVNTISKLDPPRSWPKAEKLRFYSLPYDIQSYVVKNDRENRAVVDAAINAAQEAQKEAGLPKLPKSFFKNARKEANGVQQNVAA